MLSKKRKPDRPSDSPEAAGRQPGRGTGDFPPEGRPLGSDSFPSPPLPRYEPSDGILDGRLGAGAPWLAVVAPYVLEGLPIGLYIADADGLLVHANRAALRLLGARSVTEVDDRRLTSLLPKRIEDTVLPYGVIEILGVDGVRRTVDHQVVPLGSPTLAAELSCGVLRELADPVERADIESRRLMDVGGITRRVAHDLNNMLVAVLGYAHLIAEDTPQSTAEIEQILDAAHRARELTGQILGYVGRPEQGISDVDLSQLVEQTARLFEISVPKRVRVRYELAPDLPAVRAEPTRLRQVIMNLIINAAEAVGAGGGQIVIRTETIVDAPLPTPFAPERDRLPSREYGLVEIRDNGNGMDEETLRRAFEPFFTSKPEGRGLGLATVAEIMAEHSGAIAVETAVGNGATFRVYFPIAPADGRRSLPVSPPSTVDRSRTRTREEATVLVVDEEELVRRMATTALERSGFIVLEAAGADEARGILEAPGVRVDLILLDLSLDEQDGLAVLRIAKQVCPAAKVLYCTAGERANAAAAPGLAAIVTKPYTPAALVQKIDELLNLTR